MGLFTSCFGEPETVHSRHRRRVVTKTMIGMPSNFVHTCHLGIGNIQKEGCEVAQDTEKIKALMSQVSAALDDTEALDVPKDARRRVPAPPPMRMGVAC
ncbi:hypothetical protein LPJ64_004011 [Coemansia asiatica]|uniref:CRIB domain-containing protein n=1 Tax=Coemansia asiatica TaxID=1052880 RepID=A0A9W8CI96_9FUNG|nr:hypothetical protein LPJ64_004011 [Coemansia asiatica]KAJ2869149.1 hypothetical protein FB639_004787 [Coemansia asiatica]